MIELRALGPLEISRASDTSLTPPLHRKYIALLVYSWRSVSRRWWRLVRDYWCSGHRRGRLLGTLLVTYILLQLSRFQRYHARMRVFVETLA